MSYEDKTLQCIECSEPFEFTAGEQEFFEQKGFTSPPKRCKACRKKAKRRKHNNRTPYDSEYRSPAFTDDEHLENRRRRERKNKRRRKDDYRSPSFRNEKRNHDRDYRSPGFREYEEMDNADDYRSPAFREYSNINAQEEYRSPGFREFDHIKPEEEYRSPAFQDREKPEKNERPMFEITCSVCNQKAMVPFLPEEKENPMCPDCYREHKKNNAET